MSKVSVLYVKPLSKGFIIPLLFHFIVFWRLVFEINRTAVFQHHIDGIRFEYSKQSNFLLLILRRTFVSFMPFLLQPKDNLCEQLFS